MDLPIIILEGSAAGSMVAVSVAHFPTTEDWAMDLAALVTAVLVLVLATAHTELVDMVQETPVTVA